MLKSNRVQSIDLLRGIVMVLMALDHVRDYFHADAFLYSPTDLTKTSVVLFFTRFVTHFCAPVFVFLAGTSAFLVGERKTKGELSSFLIKRGLWLVFLELTVVNFAWFFNVKFSLITLFVIWALGIGMVVLAFAIRLPLKAIVVLGVILVAGHNLLDTIHVPGGDAKAIGWSILHEMNFFQLNNYFNLFVGYPVIPWIGIMLLGYCFGIFYRPSYIDRREKIFIGIGSSAIVLFVVMRFINGYGDPSPWVESCRTGFTWLSFINVTKYPPSLFYALITLGPAILVLSQAEKLRGKFADGLTVLGRVPMFYYLLHIYLIHLVAIPAAMLTGYHFRDMIFSTWVSNSPALKGYGFSLGVVYLVWIGVVVSLYPLCKWFDGYKSRNRQKWWLSYL